MKSNLQHLNQTTVRSFPFVPPPPTPLRLVGAYYLLPSNAIFLHNDLPCNDTCSVMGGGGGEGAQTEKIPAVNSGLFRYQRRRRLIYFNSCILLRRKLIFTLNLNCTLNFNFNGNSTILVPFGSLNTLDKDLSPLWASRPALGRKYPRVKATIPRGTPLGDKDFFNNVLNHFLALFLTNISSTETSDRIKNGWKNMFISKQNYKIALPYRAKHGNLSLVGYVTLIPNMIPGKPNFLYKFSR